MASLNEIQEGTIQTLNNLLGKNACPNRQLFTSPVIKANSGGIRPAYPLVTVGKVGTTKYGLSGNTTSYFNDALNLVHETQYKVSLTIRVRGSGEQDVEEICTEIRDTLFRPYGIEELHKNTQAGLLGISSVGFSYNYLNTDYEEVATIVVDFSTTRVFVEDDPNCPSTGEITSITQNGELDHYEDDPAPLNVNTNVP